MCGRTVQPLLPLMMLVECQREDLSSARWGRNVAPPRLLAFLRRIGCVRSEETYTQWLEQATERLQTKLGRALTRRETILLDLQLSWVREANATSFKDTDTRLPPHSGSGSRVEESFQEHKRKVVSHHDCASPGMGENTTPSFVFCDLLSCHLISVKRPAPPSIPFLNTMANPNPHTLS